MARGVALCIGCLLFGLAATGATGSTAAQTIPGRIIPGVGVGKLRLGMSETAARRVLAPLGSRKFVRRVTSGTGNEYIEYEYPHPNLRWDSFAAYTVGLRGRPGNRRVAVIEVHDVRNRTRENIGVASTEKELLRAYRNLFRVDFVNREASRSEYRLGARGGRHTVFVVKGGHSFGERSTLRRVSRVMVRQPGQPSGFGL